jgi:hypothetical protein
VYGNSLAEILQVLGRSMTPLTYPPPRKWRSSFHSMAWRVSTVGLVAFSGWLIYATASELNRAAQTPPAPSNVVRDIVIRDAPDESGRRASFRILLFSDEFRWKLSSYEQVEREADQPLFTPEMKKVLAQAEEIICIGASSEEIPAGASPLEGRAREERRAARRAEQIASWVRDALSEPVPVRKLNIGHHTPTEGNQDTSDQRRVVIILVLDHDKDANIDEALRGAMVSESRKAPIFDALLTKYSLSSGAEFAWVP